jgi:hypothetical protein
MLSFANATGNLYNRLGKIGLLVSQQYTNQQAQLTNMTNTTTGVVAQYNAESDLQALIGQQYIGLLNADGSLYGGICQNLAQQTANRMIFRDNPQISQTLTSLNILTSLQNIIQQMKTAGASILAMTIGATPTAFTGYGNAILNVSTKRASDGLVLENSFQENLLITCTQDSYTGGATAGNETLSATGTGSANFFDFNFPLGSNAQASLTAINGNSNNSGGNVLTNSGYETWAGNTPSNYGISAGAFGTQIFQENSIVYDGTAALRLLGDGSTLTTWYQQFGTSAGTLGTLSPVTQYSFNVWMRRDGIAPGAGQLVVELVDQNGNQILDNNSVANAFTINLTGLTTNYASYTGVFRTPTILPTSQFLRYRLSTPLTNARSVYMDKASLGLMTQVYVSGPSLAVHAGSNNLVLNDFANCAVTNSRGAGGTLNTFQTLLARLFPIVYTNELLFPSSITPTISDGLIS